MKKAFGISVLSVVFLVSPGGPNAFAADAGDGAADGEALVESGAPLEGGGPGADDASDDGSVSGTASYAAPLGCDGALCATVAGDTTCGIARDRRSSGALPLPAAVLLGVFGVGALRRRAMRAKGRRQ